MALQTLPGMSVPIGIIPGHVAMAPSFASTLVIDATGEMAAFVGRVFFKARTGTKAISKVGFRFGAVTKAGGSALTVSLQDVLNAGGGIPMQPDGTQDQTVAIANADAGFTSNAWYQTGALSATRTVSCGDLLAVVIEFDGGGRLGADSVVISGLSATQTGHANMATSVLKTGGTYAVVSVVPNVILEFDDGTFGTLFGGFPCSNLATLTYNSGTGGADEYALEFTFPGPVKVDGGGGLWAHAVAGSDADLIVYDGTTAMTNGSVTFDGDFAVNANARASLGQFPAMLSLTKDTTYRLALKPTSANNVTLSYFDVAAAGHFQAHTGGTAWCLTSRVDGGSWAAATTTRRPFLWPHICAIDDAVSTGGTTIAGTPMLRGMV